MMVKRRTDKSANNEDIKSRVEKTRAAVSEMFSSKSYNKPSNNNQGQASSSQTKELEAGDKMEDGTIFAGVSPDTGKNMFVTPQDASGTLNWKAAMKYAADLDAHGHQDWALPTKAELNVLFENSAKVGGFNQSGCGFAGWYWSSTQDGDFFAWQRRFSDGVQEWIHKVDDVSVRPVRTELRS